MIAADVDGTLMTDDNTIPSDVLHVFDYLLSKNVRVIIASGRQLYNLYSLFKPYDNKIIFVAQNGAIITEGHKTIFEDTISPNTISQCVFYGLKNDVSIMLYTKENVLVVNSKPDVLKKLDGYNVPYEVVSDGNIQEKVFKISYFKIGGNLESLQKGLVIANIHAFIANQYMIDITNININKGTALKKLQLLYGIPKSMTCTFGDSENDIDMFKESLYSYAMSNAPKSVKKYALREAPSNNQNGVVTVLKHLFNIEEDTI